MIDTIAFAATAATWLAFLFCILQLAELRARHALSACAVVLVSGVLLVGMRTGGWDIGWLRSLSLRSDAYATMALVPLVGAASAPFLHAQARRSAWAPTSAIAAAMSCAAANLAALAIGRSGWYWEFVGLVVAGTALVVVGGAASLRHGTPANLRLTYATAAAAGAFLLVGGLLLLLAWRSIRTD